MALVDKKKASSGIKKILDLAIFYKLAILGIAIRYFKFKCLKVMNKHHLVKIKIYDFDMFVPTDSDGIGRALYVHKGRELDHKWILERVLSPESCIFDLGANIGYYVLLEASILKRNYKIFAVEPDPRNTKVLAENIKLAKIEDVVTFEQCAVSNFTGTASFILAEKTNLSRISYQEKDVSSALRIEVKVYDVAEYLLAINRKVDLVRMDIEGAEISIFQSIINACENKANLVLPGRIVFETHNYRANDKKMYELITKLFSYGYFPEYMSSDDEGKGLPVFHSYGYKPIVVIDEYGVSRGIYVGISLDHAARLISNWRGTRTVCLKLNLKE